MVMVTILSLTILLYSLTIAITVELQRGNRQATWVLKSTVSPVILPALQEGPTVPIPAEEAAEI